jgi:predicted DNA-binding transcriptional regulator AlpA
VQNRIDRARCSADKRERAIAHLPSGCDPLLSEKQLSEWLGISLPTLQRMRSNGSGPAFIQLSERRIAYRRSVVEKWLETRTITQVGSLERGLITSQVRVEVAP